MHDQDSQRAQFISSNAKAREIFLEGYERGYKAAMDELDDRIGITLVSESYLDDPAGYQRRFAKSAANAVDVYAVRKAMGTHKTGPAPQPIYPLRMVS
ncbi:hypothetical protein SLW73_03985 [Glutamicibacter protophormiae]|uniref:hypothetical protein n=1 Tax=Glutamicibacter protophormiae TaxID=37930 RepID=UPI002A838257|nr:hypothetical protein [Glutamicibacter protophormiae]WPR65492.1 hypothetical protein SLW72_03985 [Glutamicibacter protophormiae]WPR68990.1 hypothetical protein SLW73_03985 [Glutamicibacter protophormiae]